MNKLLFLFFMLTVTVLNAQTHEWSRGYGSLWDFASPSSIAVDDLGNVYTVGRFEGTQDFDPGSGTANLTANGNMDMYIHKIDSSGNFLWVKSITGALPYWSHDNSIVADNAGNIYITGYYSDSVDFDPGVGIDYRSAIGGRDGFILKLNNSGDYVWVKTFESDYIWGNEHGVSIRVNDLGQVYVAGFYRNTIDLDPGPDTLNFTAYGGENTFVMKLDSSGSLLMAKSFGDFGFVQVHSMELDTFGNIYTVGTFENASDFDPGPGTLFLSDTIGTFVHKMDSLGNLIWVKSFNSFVDNSSSAIVDVVGNVYTTGKYSDTVDFDPGPGVFNLISSNANGDAYVQKLDPSGNFVWAKRFANVSSGNIIPQSICVDPSGNIYSTGAFYGTADFDPGPGVANLIHNGAGQLVVYVLKLDSSGNYLRAWDYSSPGGPNWGNAIISDQIGNIYITGYYHGVVDFDPGPVSLTMSAGGNWIANNEVFIQKFDSTSCPWGVYTDLVTACDSFTWINGVTYTSSYSSPSNLQFLTSSTGCDSVVTLDLTIVNTSYQTDVIYACGPYTWIDGNTYSTSNNTATYILTSSTGCDSVITLDLIIDPNSTINVNTTVSGTMITATNSWATYQWLDCDNGYSTIPGQTNQSFIATANGNYAVEVTENGCVDTSACIPITTVGIRENSFYNSIKLFPNPSNGEFSIDLGKEYSSVKISILDAVGRIVFDADYTNVTTVPVLLSQAKGIYFIEVASGNKSAKLKLIIE